MTKPYGLGLLVAGSLAVYAADPVPPNVTASEPASGVTPLPVPPVIPPSNWTNKGIIGFYLTNTSTTNADTSRDATIAGATSATTMDGKADVSSEWREGKNSVQHSLKAEYARSQQRDQEWVKSKDELRYDGVYRRAFSKPHFAYLSWGFETVFQGPPPTYDTFQPFLGKVGAGYGQLYENMTKESDRFEWRLGARAQKRWGRYTTSDEDGIETGLDAFARYERQVFAKNSDQDLRYFAQYEGFSEFNDITHVTNLLTAGLTYQFTKYLTLDLAVRAYYETRTKEDENGTLPGYNQWSVRQDTLLGIAYTF